MEYTMKTRITTRLSLVVGLSLILALCAFAQVTPPPQPATGPGGSNYPFAAVTSNGPYWANNRTFSDQFKYYIYEPASPTPAQAPVILFLHGFIATTPSHYQAWINHMVMKGYVVVWVQYQVGLATNPKAYTYNALAAWTDAIYRLQHFWWEKHVRPLLDGTAQVETILVGHSVGAWLGANIASMSPTAVPSLPTPYAVVAIEPGTKGLVPAANFANINPNTKLIEVVGDQDTIACKADAITLWSGTPQIPAVNKNLLLVHSDSHGTPNQLGNHFFPNTDGYSDTAAIDDRDFNITWKLSVAAADCALGHNLAQDPQACDFALGSGSANQVSMGNWSDATPVNPLVFYSDPTTLPAITGCP
jgi:hypothetical protein